MDNYAQRSRVMVVYGTRPEAIKLAPLIKKLKEHPRIECMTVVTGQHRSMLDQVNQVFSIVPDFDLDLFADGQSLNSLTSKLFQSLDPVLIANRPDAVVVQGDTTTAMAAGIAAFYQRIPVVYLEAGLRSGDLSSPFPEEANRRILSQITSLHLAPTSSSKNNLKQENIDTENIVVTGNTVIDALLHAVESTPKSPSRLIQELKESKGRTVVVTTHRRENWGGSIQAVGRALRRIANEFPNDHIIIPLHRNPRIREALLPQIDGLDNIHVCEPLPYHDFAKLLDIAHIVLTDSGGVQEEAPTLGKPVLVLRNNTERYEAVMAGSVRLIGTDEDRVVDEVSRLMTSDIAYEAMAKVSNPYGDGRAADRSVAAICQLLGFGERLPDFQSPLQSV